MMEELIQDHVWARETTASLVKAKEDYLLDKPGALDDLMLHLGNWWCSIPGTSRKKTSISLSPAWPISARPSRPTCWPRWRSSTER